MSLVCQRATCGHVVHPTKNGQWPRFCNCAGCHCRQLVKAERVALLRERRKVSVMVQGKLVPISNFGRAVAIVQKLARELEQWEGQANSGPRLARKRKRIVKKVHQECNSGAVGPPPSV